MGAVFDRPHDHQVRRYQGVLGRTFLTDIT